jgi:hypothetical protein
MPVPTNTPARSGAETGERARLRDRFRRGDERQLAHAVEHAQLRRREVGGCVDRGGRRDAAVERDAKSASMRRMPERPAASAAKKRIGAIPQRRDHPEAGDRDAPQPGRSFASVSM